MMGRLNRLHCLALTFSGNSLQKLLCIAICFFNQGAKADEVPCISCQPPWQIVGLVHLCKDGLIQLSAQLPFPQCVDTFTAWAYQQLGGETSSLSSHREIDWKPAAETAAIQDKHFYFMLANHSVGDIQVC